MKTINKITEQELKQMSEASLSWDAAKVLFEDDWGNTYNHNEINPNVFVYKILENENLMLVALHLGGDVRGNYSDFYILDFDEGYSLISDRVILEFENQDDIDKFDKFMLENFSDIDYSIDLGSTLEIDLGNSTCIDRYIDLDLGYDTDMQFTLLNLFQ